MALTAGQMLAARQLRVSFKGVGETGVAILSNEVLQPPPIAVHGANCAYGLEVPAIGTVRSSQSMLHPGAR